ncbi:dienelactone hydrolase family protein [Gallaecimonas sp. GXIMD1310]|uniref:dienelactone hydrolase family protein n=1 Tax=Gallaecimonas sp. GXIMD1310 TaxID=3131926 RepID=UPI003250E883
MMKWLSLLTLLLTLSTQAAIREQQLTLPDQLGHAVLYQPEHPTNGAAVVVIHEWWGMNAYAKRRARMLAEAGYPAIAVDMYGTGKVADHPKDAKAFMNAAMRHPEQMNARFDAALAILRRQPGVDPHKLYAIGYCFGGGVVLNQARMGKPLAGVASFHGSLGSNIKVKPGQIKAKLLVAVGGDDPFEPETAVDALVDEMRAAKADLDLRIYPGAKHSFTNPQATELGKRFNMPLAYDKQADQKSWQALLNMLAGKA